MSPTEISTGSAATIIGEQGVALIGISCLEIGSIFHPRLAGRALRAFTDPIIYSVLRSSTGRGQWNSLLGLLEPKLTVPGDRELYNAVRAFTDPLSSFTPTPTSPAWRLRAGSSGDPPGRINPASHW